MWSMLTPSSKGMRGNSGGRRREQDPVPYVDEELGRKKAKEGRKKGTGIMTPVNRISRQPWHRPISKGLQLPHFCVFLRIFAAKKPSASRSQQRERPPRQVSQNPETNHDPNDGPCSPRPDYQADRQRLSPNPADELQPGRQSGERQQDHADGIETE